MSDFDPNSIAIPNGNIFGFPVDESSAEIVIIPVPWDVTASYGKGASNGPKAILDASLQLDFFHPRLENAHQLKVFMSAISEDWKSISDSFQEDMNEYLLFLENGGSVNHNPFFSNWLNTVNEAHSALKENLKGRIRPLIQAGKSVGILGGEHSVPLALLECLNEQEESFGVLQIDAHADLRQAYEGFEQSHASIFFNAMQNCKNIEKLVQVGIRDISQGEVDEIANSDKIQVFYDWDLKNQQFAGVNWKTQVKEIVESLPQKVYLSFDIDGLHPSLCPNTGTPVVGGLQFEEARYLIEQLVDADKQIIGFDLCEVSPAENDQEWNANVGARVLWEILVNLKISQKICISNP